MRECDRGGVCVRYLLVMVIFLRVFMGYDESFEEEEDVEEV